MSKVKYINMHNNPFENCKTKEECDIVLDALDKQTKEISKCINFY